jgi:hypothetical protein
MAMRQRWHWHWHRRRYPVARRGSVNIVVRNFDAAVVAVVVVAIVKILAVILASFCILRTGIVCIVAVPNAVVAFFGSNGRDCPVAATHMVSSLLRSVSRSSGSRSCNQSRPHQRSSADIVGTCDNCRVFRTGHGK